MQLLCFGAVLCLLYPAVNSLTCMEGHFTIPEDVNFNTTWIQYIHPDSHVYHLFEEETCLASENACERIELEIKIMSTTYLITIGKCFQNLPFFCSNIEACNIIGNRILTTGFGNTIKLQHCCASCCVGNNCNQQPLNNPACISGAEKIPFKFFMSLILSFCVLFKIHLLN